jgi:hypothetical protein
MEDAVRERNGHCCIRGGRVGGRAALKGSPRLFHSWWLAAIALCFVMTEHGLRSGRFDHVCRCDVRLHARNVNLGTAEAPLHGLPEFESEASSPFGVQARVAELDRLGRTPEQNRQVGWRAATRVAITRSILKNRSTDYY